MTNTNQNTIPRRGQEIFLPTRWSDMSPHLDFSGGLATIASVKKGISAGKEVFFITVGEIPGLAFNWEILAQNQAMLRERYAHCRARHEPDSSGRGDGFPHYTRN